MHRPEPTFERLRREPLVHFALLGALVFAVHHFLGGPAPATEDDRVLSLDDAFVRALEERARATRGESVDPETVEREWIREEVLVREARRLGVDRGDAIVRRRLVQKMELWLEATVDVEPPTEAELREALEARSESLRRPPTLAFEHVFFARSRPDADADARAALARLSDPQREAIDEPASLGDPFLLGARIAARPVAEISGSFGPELAAALEGAAVDRWVGPIASSYGSHVVRITARTEPAAPSLEEVRDALGAQLLRERREAAVRAAVDQLVAGYRVERPVVPSAR